MAVDRGTCKLRDSAVNSLYSNICHDFTLGINYETTKNAHKQNSIVLSFALRVGRIEIFLKKCHQSLVQSNFHHVVKFTNTVFNFSSVSLSLENSLVTPY